MAIYHLNIKIISRGKGKSAVAADAYRSAELLKNEYNGIIHDFNRKGGVVHSEILLPAHALDEYTDRATLWNAVEKVEKAKNAQLAREVEFALPMELTREQNIALAHEFVKRTFVDAGMCADVCIHDKGDEKPHAHVMLTMRPINENGTWGEKQKKEYIFDRNGNKIYDPVKRQYKCRSIPTTNWNDRGNAEIWRAAWEEAANAALERNGSDSRIDHRSYKRQGLNIIPSIKLGTAAHQMEKRGIRTERGDINREIEITNKQIRSLRARINKISDWLKEEAVNYKSPTLADVITDILSKDGKSSVSRLKAASQMLIFLQENEISDMADLSNKVNAMHDKLDSTSTELKKTERRIDTLKEHLRQSGYYKEHRKLKRQYDKLYSEYNAAKNDTGLFAERKAKKVLETANDFYEANRAGLTLFDAADKYLLGILQKRFDPKKLPPISEWKKELTSKLADKEMLYREYYSMKDDTHRIEKIRASVKEILHINELTPELATTRTRGMEI
jgi:ATP-dependent exoDNAse (exonuclease V) alpha subunit